MGHLAKLLLGQASKVHQRVPKSTKAGLSWSGQGAKFFFQGSLDRSTCSVYLGAQETFYQYQT